MELGCVLMAAGSGSRFGANKLAALYEGRPLYAHALCAIPGDAFTKVAVVTQYDDIRRAAELRGFRPIINNAPERGVAHTIELGLTELMGCDAVMFMVCDQPRLTQETILRELALYAEHPDNIVALGFGERRGNPAIFPREYFDELLKLNADSGGSEVIRRHPEALMLLQVEDEAQLYDVDSVYELEKLKGM